MANANLFQAYLQPARSVVDYSNDYEKADALKNQNALQSLNLQQQQAATAQSLGERNALQRIAAQSGGDRTALISGLRNSGLPGLMTQADSLEQSGAKLAESQATSGKTNTETEGLKFDQAVKRKNQHLQQLVTVSDVPGAVSWINDAVTSGELPMQQAQRVIAGLQSGQVPLAKWKTAAMMGGLDSQKQLEMTKPAYTWEKAGDRLVPVQGNAYADGGISTSVPGLAPINIGQSPDNAATIAGENARSAAALAETKTHNRASEANANGQVTYQTDASGNMVAVPSRVAPGTTVQGQAVVDSNGKVIPGKSNLTETQGKATTFAARMADAESTIKAMESKGVSGSDLRTIAAGNNYTNWLATPEGQDYRQAQENWVTANLRQESGAAIGKDEMDKDVRKFFPAPGDGESVKAQKSRARAVAQQGMMAQAGPGANQVSRILSNAGASNAAPAANGWTVEVVK